MHRVYWGRPGGVKDRSAGGCSPQDVFLTSMEDKSMGGGLKMNPFKTTELNWIDPDNWDRTNRTENQV